MIHDCPVTKDKCLEKGCKYYLGWKKEDERCGLVISNNDKFIVVDRIDIAQLRRIKDNFEKSKHLIEALEI